jgi:methyl coenzyme M reductase beta subunit
MLNLADI